MKDHKVRYGRGAQTLRFVPIDRAGRPIRVASATYSIVNVDESLSDADREIASGSAALSSVNTTLAAAGGAGQANPRALTLTLGTDVTEGRQYLLSTPIGRNLVTVDSVSGTAVQIKNAPSVAYPNGSAFQAIELEATFPLAHANLQQAIDEGRRYQIVWTYTLHGESWVTGQMVWLVRYSGEAWITEEDVIRAWPNMPDRARGKFRITDSIAAATEDFIAGLESAGQRAESYRATTQGAIAIRDRSLEYCHRWLNTDADTETANKFEQRYQTTMGNLLVAGPGTAIKLGPASDVAESARLDALWERA